MIFLSHRHFVMEEQQESDLNHTDELCRFSCILNKLRPYSEVFLSPMLMILLLFLYNNSSLGFQKLLRPSHLVETQI